MDGDQAQRPAGRPQPEEGPLPLCARPDDGEHPLDEWLTGARRKLIPSLEARANPRGPAAEAADTAVGDAETPAEAAGLDTGVGVGVPTRGWPVTSDADEVRVTALATTAETNPMIRPTR